MSFSTHFQTKALRGGPQNLQGNGVGTEGGVKLLSLSKPQSPEQRTPYTQVHHHISLWDWSFPLSRLERSTYVLSPAQHIQILSSSRATLFLWSLHMSFPLLWVPESVSQLHGLWFFSYCCGSLDLFTPNRPQTKLASWLYSAEGSWTLRVGAPLQLSRQPSWTVGDHVKVTTMQSRVTLAKKGWPSGLLGSWGDDIQGCSTHPPESFQAGKRGTCLCPGIAPIGHHFAEILFPKLLVLGSEGPPHPSRPAVCKNGKRDPHSELTQWVTQRRVCLGPNLEAFFWF